MFSYIPQLKRAQNAFQETKRDDGEIGFAVAPRPNESILVVGGVPDHELWLERCNKKQVDPYIYTIMYSRGDEQPPTYIGIYTTSTAAERVANLMREYDSVREHVLKYATNTTDITEHAILSADKDIRINYPIGEPVERIQYATKKRQIKISTAEREGYYSKYIRSGILASGIRSVILASGNLNAYIDSEKPAVDQ
jgi:hypothetical protein